MRLFDGQGDYELFIRCLIRALAYEPIPLYAYCVMPNHFHLVVQPDRDRQLADFMRHLAGSHGQLWQRSRTDIINGSEVPAEATAIQRCTWRGLPLGDATWQARMVSELGLESKQRRGRPPKARTENGVGPLFT